MTGSEDRLYSISEAARMFEVSVATLRFYEERGLVQPTTRKARVRYYDTAALRTLAYALLWHRDAQVPIGVTSEILHTTASEDRHDLVREQIQALDARVAALQQARATMVHLLECPSDDPTACPRTGADLERQVEAALSSLD